MAGRRLMLCGSQLFFNAELQVDGYSSGIGSLLI